MNYDASGQRKIIPKGNGRMTSTYYSVDPCWKDCILYDSTYTNSGKDKAMETVKSEQ
jgi:hypothetical protein